MLKTEKRLKLKHCLFVCLLVRSLASNSKNAARSTGVISNLWPCEFCCFLFLKPSFLLLLSVDMVAFFSFSLCSSHFFHRFLFTSKIPIHKMHISICIAIDLPSHSPIIVLHSIQISFEICIKFLFRHASLCFFSIFSCHAFYIVLNSYIHLHYLFCFVCIALPIPISNNNVIVFRESSLNFLLKKTKNKWNTPKYHLISNWDWLMSNIWLYRYWRISLNI